MADETIEDKLCPYFNREEMHRGEDCIAKDLDELGSEGIENRGRYCKDNYTECPDYIEPQDTDGTAATEGNDRTYRILVVDDDKSIRVLVGRWLESEWCAVDVAGSGKEGLKTAAEQRPDLVITDMLMPGMNGDVFIGELRDTGYDGPFIGISGDTGDIKVKQLGLDRFFKKPFDLNELSYAVEKTLNKRYER